MLIAGSLVFQYGSKRRRSFRIEIRSRHWRAEFWKLSEDGEVLGRRAVVELTRCGLAGHRGCGVRRAARAGEDPPAHQPACPHRHRSVHCYRGAPAGFPAGSW